MLVKEFKPDMDLKSKSDKMANERQKEKAKQNAAKAESHEIKTVVPGQKPKILGKIDLNAPVKPKQPAKAEPEVSVPKTEPQPVEPVEKPVEVVEPQPAQPVKQPEPATEVPAPAAPAEEKPVEAPAPVVEKEQPAEAPVAEKANDTAEDVFKPVSQTVGGPQLKVVGKVDLTSLNQQTRPRKKTKEEKRNERIAKAQAEGAGKKKRKRIGKEKIDIETAGNQASSQPNKGRGGRDDQGGKRGKDKKGNRKPLRPEVSEEDVQRQMKETLARLTAKTSKKAANRRRERREEHAERAGEHESQRDASERAGDRRPELPRHDELAQTPERLERRGEQDGLAQQMRRERPDRDPHEDGPEALDDAAKAADGVMDKVQDFLKNAFGPKDGEGQA